MTTLKCSCKITNHIMEFENEVQHDRGLIEQKHRISYYYKHYINICGNCRRKAIIFNDLEETKLNIEKQQFKLICEEPANEPEMSFEEMVEAGILLPNGVS